MNNEVGKVQTSMYDYGFEKNDNHYWLASWYANVLGYKSLKTLMPTILKAKKLCAQLNLDIETNFSEIEYKGKKDIQLSLFGCFMISIKADSRKPMVLRARSYFFHELEYLDGAFQDEEMLERMVGKDKMKNLQKRLTHIAGKSNVKDYRYFMNAGYLGMYRKSMSDLKSLRFLDQKDELPNHMSSTEMAGNIFRISLTTEKLKSMKDTTQLEAAHEHWKIGVQIREIIKENTGKYPEELPLKADLNELNKALNRAQKQLNTNVKSIT